MPRDQVIVVRPMPGPRGARVQVGAITALPLVEAADALAPEALDFLRNVTHTTGHDQCGGAAYPPAARAVAREAR